MPWFIRKLLSVIPFFRRRNSGPDEIIEEKWTADFSKPKHARFDIKSESSYDANLRKFGPRHYLCLGLKKNGCIVWTEAPLCRYRDFAAQGRLRIDSRGGYAAGGILFRMLDDGTYYSFLISSKGYFRLDVLRNGMPLPLVGWTELPDAAIMEMSVEHGVDFSVIAYSSHIVLLIRGVWVAEINDSTILEGSLSFAAASYEEPRDSGLLLASWPEGAGALYSAEVFLESLTVDSRITEAAAAYEQWTDVSKINPQCRIRLAETFTAMNQPKAALGQIKQAWETPGYQRSQKELLLAGRLCQVLGLLGEAESNISACFQANVDSPEGREAVTEMAKILYAEEQFRELRDYCIEAIKLRSDDPLLFTFKGHAHWSLEEYKAAAAAYDRAFELDGQNGLLAKNAANVYEVLGKKKEALNRLLAAGRVFLAADNYDDLGLLVPKLLLLGVRNPGAHGLAGKWAFGIENWNMAGEEIDRARSLEKKKQDSRDAGLAYLKALLLIREGKRQNAIPLLEEAISVEKDYALFHFKLAENYFLLENDPWNSRLNTELETALVLAPSDGWINNFAAQISLEKGESGVASEYLEKAYSSLGNVPAIRMNRAVLLARRGSVDEALRILDRDRGDDEEGLIANCAANIMAEAGRFEEADEQYRRAILASPDNIEYLCNRSSCLIEMGLYGEADTILARVYSMAPGPAVLEQISYVASKKGEYDRAEAACRAALKLDPRHIPSMLSLGWVLLRLKRIDELEKLLDRLGKLDLSPEAAKGRDELADQLESFRYTTIHCASCDRSWKVLKDSPPVKGIRLFAMPPDDLPAGSCPACGKTWCIGCAKKNMDSSGRFVCSHCGKSLKLINDGLKKIINDWASKDGPSKNKSGSRKKPGVQPKPRGRPKSGAKATSDAHSKAPDQPKRKRGRPRKDT